MAHEAVNEKGRIYQAAVTVVGLCFWLGALTSASLHQGPREWLILLALVPLTILVSMFPHTFPLPVGSRFTREKITFTLSDTIILLVACWQGIPAAVFLAGI